MRNTRNGKKLKNVNSLGDVIREVSFAYTPLSTTRSFRKGLRERICSSPQKKNGMNVTPQYPLNVYDEDTTVLGEYYADSLFIEDRLIVEIKACKSLTEEHPAQILEYLRDCA